MKNIFAEIPEAILKRMSVLESRDARDRNDDTPNLKRLRQISPETGLVLASLALAAPKGQMLEIGTSAGYSAMWLSLVSQSRGDKLVTFELLPDKVDLARETISETGIGEWVELIHGDARGHLYDYDEIAFCFLDAEKEMYEEFYELIVPKLIPGGLLVADNAVSHAEDLESFLNMARNDFKTETLLLNIGKGLLICSGRY